jgi:hypothetical protein
METRNRFCWDYDNLNSYDECTILTNADALNYVSHYFGIGGRFPQV